MTATEDFATYVEKRQREITYGCSWVAHARIGFCLSCTGASWTEELASWRLLALAQDEAARLLSRERAGAETSGANGRSTPRGAI